MKRELAMVLSILTMVLVAPVVYGQPQSINQENQVEELQKKIGELSNRLKRLEPEKRQTIYPSDYQYHNFPSTIFPVKDIIQTGKEIPFEIGLDDPKWVRPVYDENWHSSFWGGRWSYMPSHLYDSQHRMFVGYQSAAIWFGLTHSLGLEEELRNIGFAERRVNEKAVLVIMQAKVNKIIHKGNQIVLISEPKRDGLQVLAIKTANLKAANPKEAFLLQLVTPDGYEYDHRLEFFAVNSQ